MPAALVVAWGPTIYLLRAPGERPEPFPVPGGGEEVPRPATDRRPESVPPALLAELKRIDVGRAIVAGGTALADALSARLGRPIAPATPAEWRRAIRAVPEGDPASESAYLRAVAARDLERALRSPEEVLITLAREEERLERAVGREERAAESLLEVPVRAITVYAGRSRELRSALARHHAELLTTLEAAATELVPNLSSVVGPRAAARLVAAAGGVATLARFSAGRIQLLGTRRRPDPDRGPRFGLLYRTERIDDVPPGRRAAYARSVAAMAAIAVRADAWTRSPIGVRLRERRDRRIAELGRGRR